MRPDPRGEMVDIGGRRLHAVRAGPTGGGRPQVLLEAGAFGFSADWAVVQDRLADLGYASIAYDRAGLGLSDPGEAPRDGQAIVADVEALLDQLAPREPLILVGHSMAGLHVHHLAARRPERVVGLVLVDATTPRSMDSRFVSLTVEQFGHLSRLTAWGAGAGLLRPLAGTGLGDRIGLEAEVGETKRWAFADRDHNTWAAAEVDAWSAAARQALEAGELDPRWPVAVVLAGAAESRSGLRALQAEPARRSHYGSVQHVAGANHASILAGQYAEIIAGAVGQVRIAAERVTA